MTVSAALKRRVEAVESKRREGASEPGRQGALNPDTDEGLLTLLLRSPAGEVAREHGLHGNLSVDRKVDLALSRVQQYRPDLWRQGEDRVSELLATIFRAQANF